MSSELAAIYGRLHPSLRYVIATHLGWSDLRPVQRDAIGPILDGDTTVILAPTAGGKTEAAVLPLFSRILDERWAPTSVLYIAPLRALLNDLGDRIGDLAGQLGLNTAVWHGDVGQRERRRIVSASPDLLLTTPESLEVLLSFAGDDRRALLTTIRAIVIDEAHAFYGIDRGTHLLALIERLQAWAAHDVQRIALSATIGNPDDLLRWICGSSTRSSSLVRVARSADRVEAFEVCYRQSLPGVVAEITRFAGEKLIAFCRTRSDVEELAHALSGAALAAWAHHSALSRVSREDAEGSFRAASHGVLVATSTLELGIDIGDLDRVVQVDAPTTVASLLQRLGRTGRRGGPAQMTFIPTNPEQFALVGALLLLHKEGWVEPLVPPWRPFPILAQQVLATVLQTNGLAREVLVDRLSRNAAFSRITRDEIDTLVSHLLSTDILAIADGTISFGRAGERRFGFRSFMDLASVFRISKTIVVEYGGTEIGTLDSWFVDEMQARDRSTFLLNGRAWSVIKWPFDDRATLEVNPATSAEAPLFIGSGLILSFDVMQAVRRLLSDNRETTSVTPVGTLVSAASENVLAELRKNAETQRLERPMSPIIYADGKWQWFTYAGLRTNTLLADLLLAKRDIHASVTNTSVRFKSDVVDTDAVRSLVKELCDESVLHTYILDLVTKQSNVKFNDLLPAVQLKAFSQERSYDVEGALSVARLGIRVIISR